MTVDIIPGLRHVTTEDFIIFLPRLIADSHHLLSHSDFRGVPWRDTAECGHNTKPHLKERPPNDSTVSANSTNNTTSSQERPPNDGTVGCDFRAVISTVGEPVRGEGVVLPRRERFLVRVSRRRPKARGLWYPRRVYLWEEEGRTINQSD